MAYHYLFKYILIGDTSVGKSCLLLQFVERRFKAEHEVTVCTEFGGRELSIEGSNLYLQIWDTAGQERYKSITRSYYRGAAIALIVYDVTRRDSFISAKEWISEVHEHGNVGTLMVLAGNKTDLEQQRRVSTEEGKELAEKYKVMFIETSAKNGDNVNELFEMSARELIGQIRTGKINAEAFGHGIKIGVKEEKVRKKKKKRCC